MRVYFDETVFDAGLRRMRWIFENFNPVISISGGKDSTVTFRLALMVATEMNLLPLKVMYLDQEAEFQATIDAVTDIMEMDEVEPYWYQIPFKLFNSNSMSDDWLYCWAPEDEDRWMREKVPYAIKENTYGIDRFAKLLAAIQKKDFPDGTVFVGGVRCEESPTRLSALTLAETTRGITWGSVIDKKRDKFVLYPLYDWSYTDIWKAIHENGWPYCRIYDKQYSIGLPTTKMRVSSLCHEMAAGLEYVQEFEKDTWNKLCNRLGGVHSTSVLSAAGGASCPHTLPFMFDSWKEYRDYLADKLLVTEPGRTKIMAAFERWDDRYGDESMYFMAGVSTVLSNDHYLTQLGQYLNSVRMANVTAEKTQLLEEQKLA